MKTPKDIIKFGTDGWRGVIADTFTFENVGIVCQAIADVVKEKNPNPKGIAIAYDNRFQGDKFAKIAAEVMLGNSIPICLSNIPLPSQAVSFAAKHNDLDGGIMITASHNPPEYNGVKFKTPEGASADPTTTALFEKRVGESPVRKLKIDSPEADDLLLDFPFEKPYLDWVKNFIDYDVINKKSYNIVVDYFSRTGS